MVDLDEVHRSETDMAYWKEQAMTWWRMYIRNVTVVKKLRNQNRVLRLLLSDYVEETN
jgi:hypothetical protein